MLDEQPVYRIPSLASAIVIVLGVVRGARSS